MAIVKVIVRARTKRAKPCLNKGLWDLHSHSFGTRETLHMRKKAPWRPKVGITPGHNDSCSSHSTLRSILAEQCVRTQGKGPRVGQVWKKESDIGLKVNKDLEELTYVNNLTASLPHSSSLRGTPTPSLGVHLCLASVLTEQTTSVCSPHTCCALSLTINFVPAFVVSASVINAFFTEAKEPGKNSL